MPTGFGELKIFSGSAHPALAREIADYLGVSVGPGAPAALSRHGSLVSDRREHPRHRRVHRAADVRDAAGSVDQALMELMIMIDAFRRSSAARITAVIPYYGYARQDRKDKPRVPISAKLVANLLGAAGANRVLTMDLHKAQIQGFFDIPVDHLFAAPVIIEHLARQNYPNLTIVAPDAGGAERARAYAKRLGGELAVVDKRRSDDGTAGSDERDRRCRGAHLHHPGRHHRHGGHDSEGGRRAEGGGRRARDRLCGARRVVGAGDRAHRERRRSRR